MIGNRNMGRVAEKVQAATVYHGVESCPSRQELAEFLHGVEDRVGVVQHIEEHLERCSVCSGVVGELMGESDTIAHIVRSAQDDSPGGSFFAEAQRRLLAAGEEGRDIAAAERPLPRCLGQYELLEPLGSGATGRVFKARHLHLDRFVVLKVLAPRTLPDAECVARFRREMRAVGQLAHPNVVHASDASEADGYYFIVMEYCDGLSLSQVLDKCGTLSVADACEIARQTADGLQAACDHGIVHRDIKPSNLLLSVDGRVKILDLGLAEIGESRQRTQNDSPSPQLQPAGTPEYMAPEQWQPAQGIDNRTDIYALGCTLFKMLAGHSPFKTGNVGRTLELRKAHLWAPVPSVAPLRSDVPAALDVILARLLAKRREERFASPRSVARAVARFAKESDLAALARQCLGRREEETSPDRTAGATTITLPRSTRPARTRKVVAMFAVLATLIVSGVAVGWPFFAAEEAAGERAHWAADARQVYTRDPMASHKVNMAGGVPVLKVDSDNLTLVALTEHLTPRIHVRAEMPSMTAKSAGLFFGFQEIYDHGRNYVGCYRLEVGRDEHGDPILMWRSCRWRPGRQGLEQSTIRHYKLPARLEGPVRIEAIVRGPADVEVRVNGEIPVSFLDTDDPLQFTLPLTSGPAGVFSDGGSQEFCDFSAQPLHEEETPDAD